MNILVVGAGSKIASTLIPMLVDETTAHLHLATSAVIGTEHPRITGHCIDVTDREQIRNLVLQTMPNTVVNLAAFTGVDACESERALAWRLNVSLVEYLARSCRAADAHLVHVSTDYVFDGLRGPYAETDTVGPLSYYGKTKLAGENILAASGLDWTIIRTNVVYGTLADKPDFLTWVLQQFDAGNPVPAVTDQYSNPTFVDDVCETILRVVQRRRMGIYHTGGTEYCSRYEFVQHIANTFLVPQTMVTPVTTAELHQAARRPQRGGLIALKAEADLGVRMSSVEQGLVSFRHKLFQRTKPSEVSRRGLLGT